MSGVIRDLEKSNSRQLDALRRKQERELKFVQNTHETVLDEAKKANSSEVVDLQHEHQKQLHEENIKKEKVLGHMKTQLSTTRDLTDRELKELETMSLSDKASLEARFSVHRERTVGDNELYLKDINDRFNSQGQKILADGRDRVQTLEKSQGEHFEDKKIHHQRKLQDENSRFTKIFRRDNELYEKVKHEQDKGFKKERQDSLVRQTSELDKMNKSHEHTEKLRRTEFKRDFAAQQDYHEKKWQGQKAVHETEFNALKDLTKKLVNDTKTKLATEVTFQSERSKDPFYQFIELRPTMKVHEDKIEVSVAIPEHSKQDVRMSLNGKDVIVTFNRRYVDAHKDATGEKRINKVETLTSRLATNLHLNPKNVESRYENGVMTYTIKRA